MTFIDPQYQCNRCRKTVSACRGPSAYGSWYPPNDWVTVDYKKKVHLCPTCKERALEPIQECCKECPK